MKADLGALSKWRKLCAGAFVLVASSLIILDVPSFNFPDPVVDTGLDTNGIFSGVDVTSIEKPPALVKPVSNQWPTMWAHPAVKTYTFSEWAPTGSPLIVEEAKSMGVMAVTHATGVLVNEVCMIASIRRWWHGRRACGKRVREAHFRIRGLSRDRTSVSPSRSWR